MYKNINLKTSDTLKFKGKITEPELLIVIKEMDEYIKSCGANRTGSIITVIHVLYLGTKVFDMEVYLPIDKAVPSTKKFEHDESFELTNCVMGKYTGPSYLLPVALSDFCRKAESMGIELEMPFYNVFESAADIVWDLNEIEISIYAAVKNVTAI